jgi:1,4-dihydroxy-2-naphthoate octaprenyltransferase
MILFWMYSRPGIRWKGRPLLSLFAIGASTGVCGFLLGYLHDGRANFPPAVLVASLGVACLIVSLFPMSQVYQVAEDTGRHDMTFTARYGLRGMKAAYLLLFFPGTALLAASLASVNARLGGLFSLVGAAAGLIVWSQVRKLEMSQEEYPRVMRIKYLASGLFVAFLAAVLGLQAFGYLSSAPLTTTFFAAP